jgi:hypothetical protein
MVIVSTVPAGDVATAAVTFEYPPPPPPPPPWPLLTLPAM